jgi:hypothetical protein
VPSQTHSSRSPTRHQSRALAWIETYSDGKLAYILKGSTAPARDLLVAMFRTERERHSFLEGTKNKICQGVIYGKRLLISQALGPKARLGVTHEEAKAFPQLDQDALAA